jgi:hypothetical protein
MTEYKRLVALASMQNKRMVGAVWLAFIALKIKIKIKIEYNLLKVKKKQNRIMLKTKIKCLT